MFCCKYARPANLRAAVCKYQEFAVKTEISKYFIFSQKEPFGEAFSNVSRNGLLYQVQFTKTIPFCPRCCCRKQTEQSVHDRLIFGVTNL